MRLVLRVVFGVVMLAHGLQKLGDGGFAGMGPGFESMGMPAPAITGPLVLLTELVGGVALIIGLATPLFAALCFLVMLGAAILVHGDAGFFARAGGYEYTLVLAVIAIYLVVTGAGRFSVDHLLAQRLGGRSPVAA